MPRPPLVGFTSSYVVLPRDNVDTDQIIPARFLTTTTRAGLGAQAFNDWRYRADGSPDPGFVLNRPDAIGARVLVTGHNFGCGSSREHAVWALLGAGFAAVVSTGFADIFRANALGNGLLPIELPPAAVRALMDVPPSSPPNVTIDPADQMITLPDGKPATFPLPAFAKHCLLAGIDEMEFLLGAQADVERFEAMLPTSPGTLVAAR